jgi:hypothetical protein
MHLNKGAPIVESMEGQKKPVNCASVPRRIDAMARLLAESLRSFYIILLLGLICLFSIMFAWKESNRADNNIKVAWVKMQPNGTWDVEFHDESRQPEFFPATIDYILTQWVERRFSEVSVSVKADYGFVYTFMSPKLRSDFTAANGFNAAVKAAEIADCATCREIRAKVRNLDHYDSDKTNFGKQDGTLYRSNIFISKASHNADGSPMAEPEKMIVSIQWRIKAKDEIQADKEILKQNPIGLEILSYELLNDRS